MRHILITSLLLILNLNIFAGNLVQQDLEYYDALESLDNPGCGFYRTQLLHLKESDNKPLGSWGNIVHLRIDISEFSDQANIGTKENPVYGKTMPLTDDALACIDSTLKLVKQHGATAIVRACYDKYFGGQAKCDPLEQSVVEEHLKQLATVWNNNADILEYVELGMYGAYGEQHSSNIGSNENIAKALQVLLENTLPSIKIGVRRPDIIACWMGLTKKEFLIDSEKFKEVAAQKGDTIYRAGMFNDGYLGSSSDLGTVDGSLTRDMMVNWLEQYSQHTPYGGELVANYNGDNPINTPTYLSQEGFRTHTSYLNYEWHQPTILSWKDSTFYGDDEEYNGATGYEYVDNHLGYRFILRNSEVEDSVDIESDLHIKLNIENVGFGNVCSEKIVTIILRNAEGETVELNTTEPFDVRNILSRETTEAELQCNIPSTLDEGEYEVYLRISKYGDFTTDKNYQCIAFGNPSSQYNKEIGANLIGKFNAVKKMETRINEASAEREMYVKRLRNNRVVIEKNDKVFGMNGGEE